MKIITCASYHGTGSSAITDFFSEFSNCSSVESFEFRLVHDPDGIRDLEYNIIENNNRLNTSYAIKKYIKNVKHLNGNILTKKYQKYFGENFLMFSKTYIHDITELICKSSWEYDERGKGNFLGILSKLYRRILC